MGTTHELWDTGTGNVVGSCARRRDAVDIVQTLLRSFGSAYAHDLAPGRREGAGALPTVATGDDLIEAPAGTEPEPVQGARVPSP